MFEKLRKIFPREQVDEPKYWEQDVLNSYNILKFQMQLAKDAKTQDGFDADEQARRIKNRIDNLSNITCNTALQEMSLMAPQKYVYVESGNDVYFYDPAENRLVWGRYEVIETSFGFDYFPIQSTIRDVDQKIWCLDEAIVGSLAKELISQLPPRSSKRILNLATQEA